MKFTSLVLSIFVISMLGVGCVAPNLSNPEVSYSEISPNGYYTGVVPDFNANVPSDVLKRKFRLAYITIMVKECHDPEMAKETIAKAPYAMSLFMISREQNAANNTFSEALKDSTKTFLISSRKYNEACLDVAEIQMLDCDEDHDFVFNRKDMAYLNSELAKRYPNLFADEKTSFPLDVLVVAAYDPTEGVRMPTIYEAWLIGLPEHANIRKNFDKEKHPVFPLEEGWLSPYDAIAASLFKLSAEQFSGLEAANPNDHYWLDN